jgi:hypothetical protein
MDSLSRDKAKKWEHSEEFQHYIILTLERRFVQGVIVVARGRHVEVDTGVVAGAPCETRSGDALPGGGDVEASGQAATGAAP